VGVQQQLIVNGSNDLTTDDVAEQTKKYYSDILEKWSWLLSWILFAIKIAAFYLSGTKSAAASLADSGIDLASQFVMWIAGYFKYKSSVNFPMGRPQLEGLAISLSAVGMLMVCIEIIQYSALELFVGLHYGVLPELNEKRQFVAYILLAGGTFLKLVIFFYCRWAENFARSDVLSALTEDHLNDIFSTSIAVAAIVIISTVKKPNLWWIDPAGGIIIAVGIAYRWVVIIFAQTAKIAGHLAPSTFVEKVNEVCKIHSENMETNAVCYFYGSKYIVELQAKFPPETNVVTALDAAHVLQDRIELLENVERVYVQISNMTNGNIQN